MDMELSDRIGNHLRYLALLGSVRIISEEESNGSREPFEYKVIRLPSPPTKTTEYAVAPVSRFTSLSDLNSWREALLLEGISYVVNMEFTGSNRWIGHGHMVVDEPFPEGIKRTIVRAHPTYWEGMQRDITFHHYLEMQTPIDRLPKNFRFE
jgi:hypothetical protein